MSIQKSVIVAFVVGVISFALNASGYFRHTESAIVQTKNGQVRGYIAKSRDGNEYSAYVGIPFAEPPVGQLRFESPVPVSSWNGILEATTFAPDCYQFDGMVKGDFLGDEDCLYLNVFVRNTTSNKRLLPVIVWIHGGAFLSGGAKQYDPKYFMDHEIILVSVNYRLGPLGFLNTGESTVRGNMGLKDQRLALRWIKENIQNFNGNPDLITLMGESAGAALVHSHVLSPSTKGLFSKAIIQSGSLASPWSLALTPVHQAKVYGKRVGCPDKNDMKQMVACLKKLTPKQLTEPTMDFMKKSPFTEPDIVFSPTVEIIESSDAMFIENPRILMEKGSFQNVPVIMGVTSGEGGLRTARLEAINMKVETIDKKWYEFAPMLLLYDSKRRDVSDKIRDQYFSDKPFSSGDRGSFLKNFTIMMSDGWFFHSLHKAASHHLQKAPVYLYFYDYKSSLPGMYSIMKAVKSDDWLFAKIKIGMSMLTDFSRWMFGYHGPHEYGACHADDLVQLFSIDWILEIGQKSGDYQFSKNFVKSFVDFASSHENLKFNGKEWPMIKPSTSREQNKPLRLMKLDKDGSVIDEPYFSKLAFWDSLKIRS